MSFIIDEDKLINDLEEHFIVERFRTWFVGKFGRTANFNFKNDNRMFHAFIEGFNQGKAGGLEKDWQEMSEAIAPPEQGEK